MKIFSLLLYCVKKVNVFSLLALIIIKLFYREGHDNKITGKRYKKGLLKTH